jgi:4-amino-4-deoxy-L-arabinose transferase-like glycosyltransferase
MAKKPRKSRTGKVADKPVRRTVDVHACLRREDGFQPREWRWLGLILAVGLTIRLIYFFINKNNNPLFYHPVLDALFHHEWAIDILSGSFWGDEVFFRAPLYPYLLALLYKISGSSIAFAILVQHLIGACTVMLVYFWSREYFRTGVAVLAASFAALYWPLVYFEGELLIVTLIVCLDALLLYLVAVARRRGWLRLWAVPGVIAGLSAVARPSILIFVVVMPWVMRSAVRDNWIRRLIPFAVGVAVVVAPVLVRNAIVGRDFVPIASQGGVNFYIGNNPQSNGSQAHVPGARADLYGTYQGAIEMAEREAGRPLKPSQVSNHYFRKGMEFILYSPGDAMALTAKKFYLFWAGAERSNNKFIQFFWRKFGLGALPLPGFWLIGPLGLAGCILLWRKRRELAPLYVFLISYMVGVVIFFVNARFRLPVAPVLIVFAAYALSYIWVAFRSRAPSAVTAAAITVVCVGVVDLDFVRFRGVRAIDEAISYYTIGQAYMKQERHTAALEAFETAVDIQRRYPTSGYRQIAGTIDYQLGTLYRDRGNAQRAIEAFGRVQREDRLWAESRYAITDLLTRTGRPSEAIEVLEEVVRVVPNDPTALIGLARIHRHLGHRDEAAALIERLRTAWPGDPTVQSQIRAYEREGTR